MAIRSGKWTLPRGMQVLVPPPAPQALPVRSVRARHSQDPRALEPAQLPPPARTDNVDRVSRNQPKDVDRQIDEQ